jgi:predicted unusual protein kinase regulating ubiquinone biosynthesis (AarF/ABC1/UbiB family)
MDSTPLPSLTPPSYQPPLPHYPKQARVNTKVQTAIGAKPAAAPAAAASADAATYMEGGWARRGKGSAFFRTLEIWGNALQFLSKELKVRKIKDVELQRAERRKVAVFARECLLKLGPTFIKFGQLLSTRIDILPKEYTEELALLQDNVPGFSGDVAKAVIARELGRPVDELFDWFDPNPLAAASLGQVHRARFQGQELAIKIQRQGLRELFDLDLKNLKVLAILLDKFDPKSDGAARDWKSIYEESAKLLYKEIDYENEGRNAERFASDFKDIPWVKVPRIYWDFTSTRVLAMEYCPGIKVSDIAKIEAAGIDRKLLAKRSAESYLYQLCRCVLG